MNVAALIGHSALRLATMSDIRVKASDAEIGAMLDHVDEAMENGAAGFSTGLFYPTNAAADIDEVSRVAARFAKHGGVYATHMRSEMEPILDSIDETLTTAEARRHPGRHLAPQMRRAEELGPHARDAAGDRGGGEAPAGRRSTPIPTTPARPTFAPTSSPTNIRIMITWSRPHPEATGRDLTDIAAEWGVDLHEAARRLDPAGAIYFQMNEEDVRARARAFR